MALDGVSCRKIAATLNEEQVPTPATYCGWNMGRKGPYAGLWSSERISESNSSDWIFFTASLFKVLRRMYSGP